MTFSRHVLYIAGIALWMTGLASLSTCTEPILKRPSGIVRLTDGRLLVSGLESNSIYEIEQDGRTRMWAGNGRAGFAGDGQHCSEAMLNAPMDLKLDGMGKSLFVADANNHRIRRVDLKSNLIDTIIGNGQSELTGDGGLATLASLNNPQGIACDAKRRILIADTFNHVVRVVLPDGRIETFAGSEPGLAGDGGPATKAQLNMPMAVSCFSEDPSVYISDAGNSRIRRVDANGIIHTVCGMGEGSGEGGAGFGGDGGRASKSKLFSPLDVIAVRPNYFYISDSGNHRIRAVSHGIIFTVAGTGNPSDGQLSTKRDSPDALFVPAKMVIGGNDDLYFCDRGNGCVRHLTRDSKLETIQPHW